MVSMFVSSAVDREFEPQSGQTKAYEIRPQCGILILVANGHQLKKSSGQAQILESSSSISSSVDQF